MEILCAASATGVPSTQRPGNRRIRPGAALLFAIALFARHSAAQTLEIMTQFVSPNAAPAGRLLATPDGSLYGTTPAGGTYARGSIFALRPDGIGGFTFEEPFSFSGLDGRTPAAGVSVGSDGRLYGSTNAGGVSDIGSFFLFDLAGHLTQLSSSAVGAGSVPSSLTLASDGNLYGVTTYGGAHHDGIVFRLDLSGAVTNLHDLGGPDEGAIPLGGLVQAGDGRLYGTTSAGGAPDNPGTVFAIDTAGTFTTLHRFSGADGLHPAAALALGNDGALYGTTGTGGASGYGTVFRITTGGTLTTLHSFAGRVDGTDGASPDDSMVKAPDGNLYGTSNYVGLPMGSIPPTLFRVDPSGAFTTLPATGPVSAGPLTLGADGKIYMVNAGGVFRIDVSGAFSTVYEAPLFSTTLAKPYGPLIEFPDGSLYGLSRHGSLNSAIFRLDPSGQVSTFHAFSGALVNAGLLHLDDGNFYGTTALTFSNTNGGVFRVDAAGVETSLHEFSGPDGTLPEAGLTAGPSGELWGTTQRGGMTDNGTVFKFDAAGTFTSLNSFGFNGNPDYYPFSNMIHASDGNFYGLARESFFRVDSLGVITSLHEFITADSSYPQSPLVLASDGNFYGTTTPWNMPGGDSIYSIDAVGSLTPLYTFPATFTSTLMEASDTSFYGTAPGDPFAGFPYDYGSIFKMDSGGSVTTAYAFDGSFGGLAYPSGALLEASDGNFYGSAGGGLDGNGGVYRLVSATEPPSFASLEPSSGRAAGGAAVTVRGSHFRYAGAYFAGVLGFTSLFVDQAKFTALAPALPPGTLNDVAVINQDATSVTLPGAWFSDFLDVPGDHLFHAYIEKVFRNGITAGCGSGNYCPSAAVTRAQMAVFLLKAEHGSDYTPPPCTGHFADVACPGAFAVDWIEQLAAENVTAGCGDGSNYCPDNPVTRQQMAVFLLKTEHGSGYLPPPCAQLFNDVACPSPFADWIEQLAAENVTGGCGGGNYCPLSPNTRGQMATFLSKAFSLP